MGLLRRLRILGKDGLPRARPVVVFAWVPLCLGALWRVAVGERPEPILFDISTHVRLLIGIPIFVVASRLLEIHCRGAVEQLYDDELADPRDLDRIIDRAERMRDSRVVTIAIAVLAFAVGQSVLVGALGTTGIFGGVAHAGELSFAKVWYCLIGLPLLQFTMVRWGWHWLIWSYIVVHLSRVKLATTALHPDHAAGLAFLAGPINAFSTFTFGVASVIAGAWGTQILHGRATMHSFTASFLLFVLAAVIVGCGPQLAFIGQLYHARHRELRSFHRFALEYVRDFHSTWLRRPATDELGSPDIQSLNDLGGAYGTTDKTRIFTVGPRLLGSIWIAALVPMLPLVASALPMTDLAKHVGGALLGGIPL